MSAPDFLIASAIAVKSWRVVRVALDDDGRRAECLQCLGQRLHAALPERIGGMHDRPLAQLQRVDAEVGRDPRRVAVVRTRPEHPAVVDVREARVGPADHRRDARLRDRGRRRLDLRAVDRPDDRRDLAFGRELREREHGARVRALVVLDAQLDLAAEHAAGLVDLFLREREPVDGEASALGLRAGELVDHADLQRLGGVHRMGRDHRGETDEPEQPGYRFHCVLPLSPTGTDCGGGSVALVPRAHNPGRPTRRGATPRHRAATRMRGNIRHISSA